MGIAITRDGLRALDSRTLSKGRNRTKAEVRVFEIDGERVIVKDFRRRGFWIRNTIGRFSVSRESRAYERLSGLPGIPAFHGRIDAHALAYGFVEGRGLPELSRKSLPSSFFHALEAVLDGVHGRGVAILELHHRNVIVA